MAFTYDTTTDRGKVRLLVYDTGATTAVFTDADIDAFLELSGGDVFLAASMACNHRAAKGVADGIGVTLGAYGITSVDAMTWNDLADKYKAEAYRRAGGQIVEQQHELFSYEQLDSNKRLRGESD